MRQLVIFFSLMASRGILSFIFIVITIAGLVWTQDLDQVNRETIFLTSSGQADYRDFQDNFSVKELVIGTLSNTDLDKMPLLRELCRKDCELLSKDELSLGSKEIESLLKLDNGKRQAFILSQTDNARGFKEALSRIRDSKNLNVKLSGAVYTNLLLDEYSKKVKTTIFPALFVGVFLLLVLILKDLKFSLILFFPGLMAASSSLSLTKIVWGESNLINAVVPLLLFVIQISMVLHIHFTALTRKSLVLALKDKKEPIALMVVTTFIGFGSLYFSSLQVISEFGILTAVLILLTTALSLFWLICLPLPIKKIWERKEIIKESSQWKRLYQWLGDYWSFRKILVLSLLSLAFGGAVLFRIPVITDATRYFPKESQIRENMVSIAKNFIGIPLVEVIIKGEQSFKQYQELNVYEEKLDKAFPGMWLSSNKIVKLINSEYSQSFTIPENKYSYFTLRSRAPKILSEGYPLEGDYRLTYLGAPINVDRYEELVSQIKSIFQDSSFDIAYNGLYFHLMNAQKKMIGTLFKSFTISLFIISFLSFLYFKKIRIFFIFLGVNIIPVFASFITLWGLGLSFNIATVMTFSISLGLIVDSSFHIIHGLNQRDLSKDQFVKSVLVPIAGASLLLALCFSFFFLSDFLPIREFGVSLAIVIFFGMMVDLKFLPQIYKNRGES